jgi:hypothetical protein
MTTHASTTDLAAPAPALRRDWSRGPGPRRLPGRHDGAWPGRQRQGKRKRNAGTLQKTLGTLRIQEDTTPPGIALRCPAGVDGAALSMWILQSNSFGRRRTRNW